jgi:hypothetical protein
VEVDASLASAASAPPGGGSGSGTQSSATAPAGKKKKVPLNGGDKLFDELRDLNFAVVGGLLNKVAKRINADYEERHNAKTVPQIRQFIVKMGGLAAEHQSLRLRMSYSVLFAVWKQLKQMVVAGEGPVTEPILYDSIASS